MIVSVAMWLCAIGSFTFRRLPWWDPQMSQFKMIGQTSVRAKMRNAVSRYLTEWMSTLEVWAIDKAIVRVRGTGVQFGGEPMKVLIDNSIQRQFTSASQTVEYKQRASWPDGVPRDILVVGHEPIYCKPVSDKDGKLGENMAYVPGLLYHVRQDCLKLFTSDALLAERIIHAVGDYSRIGWFSYDMFSDIEVPCLDGYEVFCFCDDALEYKDDMICFREDWFRQRQTLQGSNEYGGRLILSTDKDPIGSAPKAKEKLKEWLEQKRGEVPPLIVLLNA